MLIRIISVCVSSSTCWITFPLVHLRHRRSYRLTGNDARSLAVGVQENVEDVLR